MKVTVIIDNTVPIGTRLPFLAEHGLSLLIEHAGKKVLFDTGQSSAVVSNLSLLGFRPSELDMLVVSHGHYDHTGGIFTCCSMRERRFQFMHIRHISAPILLAGQTAPVHRNPA